MNTPIDGASPNSGEPRLNIPTHKEEDALAPERVAQLAGQRKHNDLDDFDRQ
jgi:hypothetical protein